MAYTPTTFTDRAVQYPGRRLLTPVSGIADTYDVARAEGTVFEVGTELDAANLNAEFVKIKDETDLLGLKSTGKVLWTNSSPTSSFLAQTITLSETIANFTKYEILFKGKNSTSVMYSTGKLPKEYICRLLQSTNVNIVRDVTSLSSTSATFTDCGYYSTYGSGYTIDNANNIPYQIIGYK